MSQLQELIERDQWAELLLTTKEITKNNKNAEIEILAFSKDEAIKKASSVFQVAPDHLMYKEIKPSKTTLFGLIRTAGRYLCSVQPEIIQNIEVTPNYDQYNTYAQNKNGSFSLRMFKSGLQLSISPPIGLGTPITFEMIKKVIQEKEFPNIKDDLIKKALLTPNTVVTIAPYSGSRIQDSTYHAFTEQNDMIGRFTFSKPIQRGRLPEIYEIMDAFHNIGVFHGINQDRIREAINNELYDIPIIAAEGTPMIQGIDGYIEYLFMANKDSMKHALRSDGSIDFKKMNIIDNVHKNEKIAVKHSPTLGTAGKNIKGIEITPTPGKDISWNIGANVSLSADGNQAFATQAGQVIIKGNTISVEPVFEVASDLDLTIGDIDFVGNVLIKGNVNDGFTIISGGNVEIHGHIGKCFIQAEGNIIAHKGIQGKDAARIECHGDLYAKFIEHAHLTVGGNIIVNEAILHSTVISDSSIYVISGKKGVIVGGNVMAKTEIVAKQIGAESYAATNIETGVSHQLSTKYNALHEFIKDKEQQLKLMEQEYKELETYMDHDNMNTLNKKMNMLRNQKANSQVLLEEVLENISSLRGNASISADKFLPGVKLKIGETGLEIPSPQNSGTVIQLNDKLIFTAYKTSAFLEDLMQKDSEQSNKK